jgi:ABC-type polysaccharide/polyol phosphate export permease
MLREVYRYRALVRNLVLKDLKLKYRDSLLGVVWSLLNPALHIAVYTWAFKGVLRIPLDDYSHFLLAGLLPWNFFAGALLASTWSIRANGSLIRKAHFPTETLPIATVLFSLAQLLLALAVFLPVMALLSGAGVRWTAVLLLPLLALHALFTIGLALLLSALTAFFRDVAHLTEVALAMLFWVTPVVYPASLAPEALRGLLEWSPLAAFSGAYQDVLFWGRLPGPARLASIAAAAAFALALGWRVFRALSPRFAEEV